jgi:hypothetical protein
VCVITSKILLEQKTKAEIYFWSAWTVVFLCDRRQASQREKRTLSRGDFREKSRIFHAEFIARLNSPALLDSAVCNDFLGVMQIICLTSDVGDHIRHVVVLIHHLPRRAKVMAAKKTAKKAAKKTKTTKKAAGKTAKKKKAKRSAKKASAKAGQKRSSGKKSAPKPAKKAAAKRSTGGRGKASGPKASPPAGVPSMLGGAPTSSQGLDDGEE